MFHISLLKIQYIKPNEITIRFIKNVSIKTNVMRCILSVEYM